VKGPAVTPFVRFRNAVTTIGPAPRTELLRMTNRLESTYTLWPDWGQKKLPPTYMALASTPSVSKSRRQPASPPTGVTASCWKAKKVNELVDVIVLPLLTASSTRLAGWGPPMVGSKVIIVMNQRPDSRSNRT